MKILLVAFLGLTTLPFVYGRDAAEADTGLETVTLSLHQPQGDSSYLPHLVALDQGYFKDAGIELALIDFQSTVFESTDALATAGIEPLADIYLHGRANVYALEAVNPGTFKVFNINVQHETRWNDAILTHKSLGVKSLDDLDPAMPIGIVDMGGARREMIRILMKKHGRNPEGFRFRALSSHQVNADREIPMPLMETTCMVYAREPFKSMLLARGDWTALFDEALFAKNIFSPWPMSMTLFSARFLRERPGTAAKVAGVYSRSLAFIRNQPQKAQEILSAYLLEKYGVKGLKPGLCDYLIAGPGHIPLLQRQSDWYAEKGLNAGKIKAADLIYSARPGKPSAASGDAGEGD